MLLSLSSPPIALFRRCEASHGKSAMSDTSLPGKIKVLPLYLGRARYSSKENLLQDISSSTRDRSWFHCQWHSQLFPIFSGPSLVLCRFFHYQSSVSDLSLAQIICFCGHHALDLFAHIIVLPTLGLVSSSSAQGFTVALCICFHQSLDEGTMVTINAVINFTGKG